MIKNKASFGSLDACCRSNICPPLLHTVRYFNIKNKLAIHNDVHACVLTAHYIAPSQPSNWIVYSAVAAIAQYDYT